MTKAKAPGYLKLHRSIEDWEWYFDVPVRTLFLDLLVLARYRPGKWKGNDVEPGKVITSTVKLAERNGVSRAAVHRMLTKLKSTGEVDVQSNNHWTTVTIVNWDKWQGKEEDGERPLRHRRTTSGRPAGTSEEGKKGRREEDIQSARAAFKSKCKEICDADPEILHATLRQGFFDYWTERDTNGVMRFENADYFDHARRMRTWQGKAIKSGDLKLDGDKHNPRA